MTRTALVAGATGLVGQALVRTLAARPEVSRVICLVRDERAALNTIAHDEEGQAKVEQRVVDFTALPTDLVPADTLVDAYCALGTTMKKAGSQEAFLKVDKDAVLAFASMAIAGGVKRFLLVSSLGANPASRNFYLRTKGEVENAIRDLGFDTLVVARPSILDGVRDEARTAEQAALAVGRVIGKIATALLGAPPNQAPIPADKVAGSLVYTAFSGRKGFVVLSSSLMHDIGRMT